ncbi:SH3 domain-containing protein, partial [Antarctobacter heliothermus]
MLRLLTLLSAIFLASAAAATTLWVDAPRDGYLNLRTGPSVQYDVLGKMPHASRVKLLEAPGKWVKVRHVSGLIGWAHSGFLTDHDPAKGHDRDVGHNRGQDYWIDAPRDGHLNLRNGPGRSYTVIDKMPHGAKARVIYKQDGWYKLTFEGRTGWASSRFLSDRKPSVDHGRDGG